MKASEYAATTGYVGPQLREVALRDALRGVDLGGHDERIIA
ncbi:hypothetical protein [Phytohabitans kaempferiae]|uniref:Uncharacterized protein n=1 Tax=Phytohabitans kaempferiae TaxID=1620943 RepID=A0ABV6MD32_9ACTN